MSKKLSKTTHPIESFKLLKSFLLLWKRLEVFKRVWAKRKLIVEVIDTPTLYKAFWLVFIARIYKTMNKVY